MRFNLANVLTFTRLLLVPVLLVAFIYKFYLIAFLAFLAASFTDLVDGSVARLLRQHSRFGALLDPIADKFLMITTFSCLVSIRFIPSFFLILVILRDAMVMGGVGMLKLLHIDVEYRPFISSKLATLGQMALGSLSLWTLWMPDAHILVYPIGDFAEGIMYVTAVLIIVSGLQYIQKGIMIIQKGGDRDISPKHRAKAVQRGFDTTREAP